MSDRRAAPIERTICTACQISSRSAPTPHKAVVGRRDVEGVFEEDAPQVHEEGRAESHGNGIQDVVSSMFISRNVCPYA